MSIGLGLLSAIIAEVAPGMLARVDPVTLIDDERIVYDFVRGHFRTYQALPEVQTVADGTGVRLPAAVESLGYYVDKVRDRHTYNQIRDRFSSLRDALSRHDLSLLGSSIANMHGVLTQHRRDASQAGVHSDINEGIQQVIDRLGDIRGSGGITGVQTGWPRFDAATGGYQDADLITWVGRPMMGKTYLMLYQALHAYESGRSVLFVTAEMSTEQISRRLVAMRLGVDPTQLKNGTVSTYTERRIRALLTESVSLGNLRLMSVGMSANTSTIDALSQELCPDIIFVDGGYLLRPTGVAYNATQNDRVSGVFKDMKTLTLELNRPIVISTQFNRQAGKGGGEGSLENISYTDAIGTHSSIVVAIKEGPTENKRESRVLEFLKGREGEAGRIAINFKFSPVDMGELPQQDYAAEEVGDESTDWMSQQARGPHRRRAGGRDV